MGLNGYSWWMYPQKPVRINQRTFEGLNLDEYTLEPKIDGHRVLVIAGTNCVYVYTRQKRRIRLPEYLTQELVASEFPAGTVLDGEIWNMHKRGGWKQFDRDGFNITFWDVIRYGTNDLSRMPIEDRRDSLFNLLDPHHKHLLPTEILKPSAEILAMLHEKAASVRNEPSIRSGYIHGAVLKRNRSPRRDHATQSKKHPDWLKILFPGMEGWEPRI
jgi:ATP-dependent DNA ligase